jgi:hypothetical protein
MTTTTGPARTLARQPAPPALRASSTDPRVLVARLRTEVVAEVVAGDGPHRFVSFGAQVFFRCPICKHRDFNVPSGTLVDDVRWRCTRCRHEGTRYELERLVLEDAETLDRMLRIIAERDA